MSEQFRAHDDVDWSNPENLASEHNKRYHDSLMNAAAIDVTHPSNHFVRGADGKDAHVELDVKFLNRLRNVVMYHLLNNFVATGGTYEEGHDLIEMGNGLQGGEVRRGEVLIFKAKL